MKCGSHGMMVGNIEKNKKLELSFMPVDPKEFVEEELEITNILSKEELIEYINQKKFQENQYYKILLTGKRNFEVNSSEILKQIEHQNIIKIKDITAMPINLEELAKQTSLKGIFVKNMLQKIQEDNQEEILKAIEIGLSAM